jgi:streptogramin lyase
MLNRLHILAGIALATVVLFGCGGDNDKKAASSTQKTKLPKTIRAAGAKRVDLSDVQGAKVSIPHPDWMVPAFGSLWVKRDDMGVVRVNPKTGKVAARVDTGPVGHVCQGIGASEEAVYSCPREGEVVRIDPARNRVAATIEIDKLLVQGRLVSAAGRLWLVTAMGAKLTGIDPRTNKPAKTYKLPGRCTELVPSGNYLWVMCPDDDRVLRLDARTGKVAGKLALAGATTASLSDHLWVGFDRGVAEVDPRTLDVLTVYDVHPRDVGGISATSDAVWVREEGNRFLTRIDPRARRIAEIVDAPGIPSGGDVVQIGGSVWATAYDDHVLVEVRP